MALAASSTVALGLLVASAAARVPALAALRHYSRPVLDRGDPTSAVTGAIAALVLTGAALAVAIAFRRRARALAESYRRAARLHDDGTVVVVTGPDVEAYALPGSPGRIVVSGRLFQALDDPGRAALLAHERAHLAGRHHLFTSVAYLAAAANPVLIPLARAVEYTVERWADEHAARVTGDRRLVAATIGQVAMLATPTRRPAAAALGIVGAGSAAAPRTRAGPPRAPAGSRSPGPGRCPAGSPPCSRRRRAPASCCSRSRSWSCCSPGGPPSRPPGTCTRCSRWPASFTEPGGARPPDPAAGRARPGVASVSPPQVSPAGTAAVLQVYPVTSPQAAATSDLVRRLRDTIIPRATTGTGVTVYVGGPTATFIDLGALLASRLLPFIAVVLAIGFVLLLLVFRSLAIPLTAAVLNRLSIGAALGVVVAVFQYGWTGLPAGPVNFAVPTMTFAIVFGLSTDYQVFLLSRIKEEWDTDRDNARAVHDGVSRVSGIITGAAIIMIAVFGSFVLGGQLLLQEFGVGFAVAVALDAFLIRFALAPALIYILGDRNWKLPAWLDWLPGVRVQAAGPRSGTSKPTKRPALTRRPRRCNRTRAAR